jgi:hypothetical protein
LPTLPHDEVDALFTGGGKRSESLRAIYNAGHRRGATVLRCAREDTTIVPRAYPVFCAAALAGLGFLPDSLMTRSIHIGMRRSETPVTA